jgi:LCP family protein required for cell wall assembly
MSELQQQPEFRSRSELRTRSNAAPTLPGIARHGRLRKANPWPSILKFTAAALAVVLISGVSVGAIAVNSILAQRNDAVTLVGETEGPPPQIGAIEGGFNILIVGSDQCESQSCRQGERGEAVLNDVNILLHVAQDQTNATVISFPRDMVVGIPECPWADGSGDTKGYSTEPLNVAYYYGGLPCVVLTIQELTGLPIQFAGMITFQGVIEMSDAIGGVDVCVNGPVVDPYTGIDLPEAGTYNLQGWSALAFLRSRHGVGDGSDLTRISSQQVYLSSLVRKLKSDDTLGDASKLYGLAQAAVSNMSLSRGLADVPTLVSVALALKDIPIERVTFVQYPGATGGDGIYAGKVRPLEDKGAELMALIAADQPFALAAVGDGQGSEIDPNAPVATPDPSAAPVDNSGLPVIEGVRGQTAADYTCSVSNN